jgi:hypothetical protein
MIRQTLDTLVVRNSICTLPCLFSYRYKLYCHVWTSTQGSSRHNKSMLSLSVAHMIYRLWWTVHRDLNFRQLDVGAFYFLYLFQNLKMYYFKIDTLIDNETAVVIWSISKSVGIVFLKWSWGKSKTCVRAFMKMIVCKHMNAHIYVVITKLMSSFLLRSEGHHE